MLTPQPDAGCAGIARARRRGHLAESARPWRCVARGGSSLAARAEARHTEERGLPDIVLEEKRVFLL